MIWIAIAGWLACGFLAYGFLLADLQRSFLRRRMEYRSGNIRVSILVGALGPLGLVTVIMAGSSRNGFMIWLPREHASE